MADTDQEKLYLCMLKLLQKGSNKDFKKLQGLCKEISGDLPHLDQIPDYKGNKKDERAMSQLTSIAEETEDPDRLIPVETERDTSCLFRALSILYFGNQQRHRELRVRCIMEMALNSNRYVNDKNLLKRKNAEKKYFSKKNKAGTSRNESENDFKNDVLKTCDPNKSTNIVHIQVLSDILKREIEIIPKSESHDEELKELQKPLKCTLKPERVQPESALKLKIMWLLDDEHFVPLLSEELLKDQNDEDERVDITSDDAITQFEEILECKPIRTRKPLSNENLKTLTGPYQMADPKSIGISKKNTVMFVTKLIEVQFQIKWKTNDGRPERFNFYDFCNVERQPAAKKSEQKKELGKTVHLKYDPRRAHVFTELYREAFDIRSKNERKEVFCLDKCKEVFCPDVYVNIKNHGWHKIRPDYPSEKWKYEKVDDFENHFSWMHESLRKFVAEAEEITLEDTEVNYKSVTKADKKPTLYWAVLEDTDFKRGDHLKLHDIGRTQVYVGKANNGMLRRWIHGANSHAKQMKKCAKIISSMKESFELPNGIQLVDARLLLARIKKEKHALFLIQTFKNKEDLEKGERNHREGKRSGKMNVNIVPYKDIRDTWTPKKMKFGMNKT